MSGKAILEYDGKKIELDAVVGTENEVGLDITKLRASTGMITLDPGYANTGSCTSDITFIDGEKGILRYRGYAIEELAEKSTFMETAYLILYGRLPSQKELNEFDAGVAAEAGLHNSMKNHFDGFPDNAPPMAILSSMLNTLACYNTELLTTSHEGEDFDMATRKIISKVRTIAAWAYRTSLGHPYMPPCPNLSYSGNFLHMMFSQPFDLHEIIPEVEEAIDLFLLLHADHEQNCSTSTVRMVGSSRANLFSSVAAGVGALWGPLHGGANAAVIKMLSNIHDNGIKLSDYVDAAKDKNNDTKLMGFGHRVYKSFDPRAKILEKHVDIVLEKLKINDPLLDIAKQLEEVARHDEYFIERNL
ncbi:MAG: citrate (Si)-synthase, partial [Verrucomicrobia bacterium]